MRDLVVYILERIVVIEFVEDRKQEHIAGNVFLLAKLYDLQQRFPVGFPSRIGIAIE